MLLRRAELIDEVAAASIVFAAEDEAELLHPDSSCNSRGGPLVLTWTTFLERLVPGHDARRLHLATTQTPAGGKRPRAPGS